MDLDATDLALIAKLRAEPRAAVSRLARLVGVARGTVQARIRRLEDEGVLDMAPDVNPGAVGYGVLAFTTLSIAQGAHDRTIAQLTEIPELVEVHTVTGSGDLFCRVVARSNDHLHEVLQAVAAISEVAHSETVLALSTPIRRAVADLVTPRP